MALSGFSIAYLIHEVHAAARSFNALVDFVPLNVFHFLATLKDRELARLIQSISLDFHREGERESDIVRLRVVLDRFCIGVADKRVRSRTGAKCVVVCGYRISLCLLVK